MSLSMEEVRKRHIAFPGDEMLCPGCGAALLRFTGHTFCKAEFLSAADKRETSRGRYKLYCAVCGAGATKAGWGTGSPNIEDAEWSCMLVRSGGWTGWRALSGE